MISGDWSATLEINASALKFGVVNVSAPTIRVIPGCFIVGAMCGVMGALFVIVNNWMGFFRKYYITKTWMRPIKLRYFPSASLQSSSGLLTYSLSV